jgi:hypothetical protein
VVVKLIMIANDGNDIIRFLSFHPMYPSETTADAMPV